MPAIHLTKNYNYGVIEEKNMLRPFIHMYVNRLRAYVLLYNHCVVTEIPHVTCTFSYES